VAGFSAAETTAAENVMCDWRCDAPGTTCLYTYVISNLCSCGVPPVTEDAPVLLRTAAPNDCRFYSMLQMY